MNSDLGNLYYVCLHGEPKPDATTQFFTWDLTYEPYFSDFGPLKISTIILFCRALQAFRKVDHSIHILLFTLQENEIN